MEEVDIRRRQRLATLLQQESNRKSLAKFPEGQPLPEYARISRQELESDAEQMVIKAINDLEHNRGADAAYTGS